MNTTPPPTDHSSRHVDQRGQVVHGSQTNIAGDQHNHFPADSDRPKRQIDLGVALARLAQMPFDHLPERGNLPGNSQMPFGWNQHFVGRQEELLALASALRKGNTAAFVSASDPASSTASVAATGIGGVGKSQLAAAFVHYFGQYFLGGVFWISFADPQAISTQVASCAEKMDDLPLWVHQLSPAEQVPHMRRAWQEPLPRLLIFDNCEDPALLQAWQPSSGGCHILLTSRRNRWNSAHGLTTVPVATLPRSQSVELLQKHRPTPTLSGWETPLLAEIAGELGDLPLALHMAGSYLHLLSPDLSPQHYLRELRRHDLLDHESMQSGDFTPTGHELHVARTFALSLRQLQRANEIDAQALRLLATAALLAPGETMPRLLLRTAAGLADEEQNTLAGKALRRLLDLGLLEEDANNDLRLHRLLCQFVAKELQSDLPDLLTSVEAALLALANQQNNEGDPRPLLRWQPHLRHLTDRAAARPDEIAAVLCNVLGFHLHTIGEYAAARPYYERALAIWEDRLGAKHPDTANSLNNLGGLLDSMGEYAAARPYYERALTIWEEVLGPKHPDTANSLNNLGMLLQAQGGYAGARPYLEQALAIREDVLGAKHPDTAHSLNNLGVLLQVKGEYAAARPYLERALAIWEDMLGAKHPDTAQSLNNLGMLLQAQGEYTEARPYYERALAIWEEVLGAKHPHTAQSLNNLGMLLQAQGKYAGAHPYLERALAIYVDMLGAKHPDTAQGLNNLGGLLQAQGEYTEAHPYYERALAIWEEVLGAKHPHTATSLNNLGMLLQVQGEYAAARPYLERALAIQEEMLGAKHPDTATSLNNLGMLLQTQGEYAAACPYLERALAIWEDMLGAKHPDTANSLNNLGVLLQVKREYAAARPYLERALAIREEVLGPKHPDTAQSLNNLGGLLQAQGEYAAARPYLERSLAIWEEVLGPKHQDTAQSLNNLGGLLQAQGEHAAARPYYERSLAILEEVLGAKHPDTASSLNNLGALAYYEGKKPAAAEYLARALAIYEAVLGVNHPDTQRTQQSLAVVRAELAGSAEPPGGASQ